MELISICIPTYNGATHLAPCISSAIGQTYKNLEVLIVDDGSSDDSVQIARTASARDDRVRVIENDRNLGLVGNWNRCIETARGTWIKFLFQDDLLHPECVQELHSLAKRESHRFVACERDFEFDSSITEDLRSIYAENRAVINRFLATRCGASASEYGRRILSRTNKNFIGEPTVSLLHRSLFEQYGLFNDELAQLCDIEFWARIATHEGVAFLAKPLATFRVHKAATSAVNRSLNSFRASGLDSLVLLDLFLEQDVYRALRKIWDSYGLLEKAERMRWDRANRAMSFVRGHRGKSDSKKIETEYEAFLQRHPKCRISIARHLAWLAIDTPRRYKFLLGQRLNPLLPKVLRRETAEPL